MKFTPEEIEEMRRADEEIERDFRWTSDELAASRSRDAEAILFQKDSRGRSIAEKQQWIRHKRLNRGYSQYALAEAIGSSQSMISQLESGEMKLETFFAKDALCAVLGVRL